MGEKNLERLSEECKEAMMKVEYYIPFNLFNPRLYKEITEIFNKFPLREIVEYLSNLISKRYQHKKIKSDKN